MVRWGFAAFALALIAPVHAQPPAALQPASSVVGRYEYRDNELVGHIDLRADSSFDYRVVGLGPPVEGEGPFDYRVQGVWHLADRGGIELTNVPAGPPRLDQTRAARDPSVRVAVTITRPDGLPVEGVAVIADEEGGINYMSSPEWSIPLFYEQANADVTGIKRVASKLPPKIIVMRLSDDRVLADVALTPGGTNRFAFFYTPSAVEPFRLAAFVDPKTPDNITVAFGQASIEMRRGRPVTRRTPKSQSIVIPHRARDER